MFDEDERFSIYCMISSNSSHCCTPVFHRCDEVVNKNLKFLLQCIRNTSFKSQTVNAGIGLAVMNYPSVSLAC